MSERSSDVLSSTVFDWDEDVRMQEELDLKSNHLLRGVRKPMGTLSSQIEEGIRGWSCATSLSTQPPLAKENEHT